ncbi:MAG TPA: 4-(cytidine 5'-diphospho)-2-C-methyl-D-erythritol kinase [Opitutaceae bacterium]
MSTIVPLSVRTFPSPAKVNLFLAVTGRRTDGYHDLLSLVAPLDWGDSLEVEPAPSMAVDCDMPGVPLGADNLVARAAAAFAEATGWLGGASIRIRKVVPMGAGLGGASSNAAAALRALNLMAGGPLSEAALSLLASRVGSDCPLFLSGRPVVMRGRGEIVEAVPSAALGRIRGTRLLVFKPAFPVATPWAYGVLAATPGSYVDPARAEEMLSGWMAGGSGLGDLLYNSMERAVFPKYPALPVLLRELRGRFGLAAVMSGSGSACLAVLPEGLDAAPVAEAVRRAWGPSAFIREGAIS